MILADTSVWIDHLRKGEAGLARLLNEAQVLTHPFIIGEIALGNLKKRRQILESLANLPSATLASNEEVLDFIETTALPGSGVGYLDAHLLTSAKLTPGAKIWTRDGKLRAAASAMDLAVAMREGS